MDITGEYRIGAPREQVWKALNDPEVLRVCIPGCEELTHATDTEFAAKVTAKVGPIKATFRGRVTLSEVDAPNGYRISGEGQGGTAGFAKGSAKVSLADDGNATLLRYVADAQIGGKLASVGSRVIQGVAKKMSDDFFAKFVEEVGGGEVAAPSEPVRPEPVAAGAGGLRWQVVVGVIAAAALAVLVALLS